MINKFLGKRVIAFLLCFTITFYSVSNVRQESASAIAIVDDVLFWTVGSLLLAAGFSIVKDSVHKAYDFKQSLGRDFVSKWISSGKSTADLFIRNSLGFVVGLNITQKFKDFLTSFSAPSSVTSYTSSYSSVDKLPNYDSSTGSFVVPVSGNFLNGFSRRINYIINVPINWSVVILYFGSSSVAVSSDIMTLPDSKLYLSANSSDYLAFYNCYGYAEYRGVIPSRITSIKILDSVRNELPFTITPIDNFVSVPLDGSVLKDKVSSYPVTNDDTVSILPIPTLDSYEKYKDVDVPITDSNIKDIFTSISKDSVVDNVVDKDIVDTWGNGVLTPPSTDFSPPTKSLDFSPLCLTLTLTRTSHSNSPTH